MCLLSMMVISRSNVWQVTPEDVFGALREGLEYYLESYSDPDFVEDEAMYDSLPLDEVRQRYGFAAAALCTTDPC